MTYKEILTRTAARAAAILGLSLPAAAGDRGYDDYDHDNRHDKSSSYDPAYNVCRGVDPRCYHDWAAAEREGNRVLIYSRTAGPRHANLGPRLPAGLNPPLGAGNVVQNA